MQLDAECSQLHQQINDLKETLVKETRSWETDRTSLSRQLELVGSFARFCYAFQRFMLCNILFYYCIFVDQILALSP